MRLLAMVFLTVITLTLFIGACRILSMTFKTFSRSITIKNRNLAAILIAYENTWGIATSTNKRNKMCLLGFFAYVFFLPEIIYLAYDWYNFLKIGVVEQCSGEKTYLAVVPWFYIVGMIVKIIEAQKFKQGKIW